MSDPTEELVDVVDAQDRVIDTVTRGEVYRRRLTHRCATVLVRDAEGRVFTHRRAPWKLYAPGTYDVFVGGVVGAGESYADAAVREAEEELGVTGITVEPAFKFLFEEDGFGWFCDVYTATWTGSVAPQQSEIDWHGWLTDEEIAERLAAGEWRFVPDGLVAWHRYRELRGELG
ncbi:NUDIX domain-containing protein [Kitasatospora acidiphila]|uniref:NUDIX domain-containing protein n=1 Tax=Kitasatospora acidiphila TaxID=2567942 RepID=UPI003C745146